MFTTVSEVSHLPLVGPQSELFHLLGSLAPELLRCSMELDEGLLPLIEGEDTLSPLLGKLWGQAHPIPEIPGKSGSPLPGIASGSTMQVYFGRELEFPTQSRNLGSALPA